MDNNRKEINKLIFEIRERKTDSVEKLYDLISPNIRYIALKYLQNEAEALDVTQDFWADIHFICDSFLYFKNGFSYLCKVMTNRVINRYHKLKRDRNYVAQYVDYLLIENYSQYDSIEQAEVRTDVSNAMKKLSETQKIIIQETFFEHKTIREIAHEMHISKSKVGELKKTAEAILKKELESADK